MNCCLEFNSFGLNQTFVLEKENHSFCGIFHLFLKTLNLAMCQGARDQGTSVFSVSLFLPLDFLPARKALLPPEGLARES